MHTALVSRLIKDRSAWELAHVPMVSEPADDEAPTPTESNAAKTAPALIGV
jgi:hypothetical protein